MRMENEENVNYLSPENIELMDKQIIKMRRLPFFPASAPNSKAPQPIPNNVILASQFFSSSKMQYSTSVDGNI